MNIMVTVNAMGDNCPIPVIKTKKAMQALTGPEIMRLLYRMLQNWQKNRAEK